MASENHRDSGRCCATTASYPRSKPQAMQLADTKFETIIFDCDGVIWGIASEETKRSVRMINYLLYARVMFVTNNSNKTRKAFVHELESKGICFGNRTQEEKLNMMMSAAFTTAKYLIEHKCKCPFVITSDTGLLDELKEAGVHKFYATIDEHGIPLAEFAREKNFQDTSVAREVIEKHIDDVDSIGG